MLKHIMASWDKLAQDDALTAILTTDGGVAQRWNEAEFFATGVTAVDAVLARLELMGESPGMGRALDFGCGVGRLTHALSQRFEAVDGVDVSRVMIEKAAALRKTPAHVRFLHNPRGDMSLLSGTRYSFVLSLICLQHMPERVALGYIRGMCDLLAPAGVAYLQISTHLNPAQPDTRAKLARDASRLNRIYRRLRGLLFPVRTLSSQTHYCRLSEITRVLEEKRMRIVSVLPDASLPKRFVSHVVVFKNPAVVGH